MAYRSNPLETLLTRLSGWLPVLAGVGLLAMALITPAWLSWRELLWQRDMVSLQAHQLSTQRANYAEFHEALIADDPVLLERLAFTHLRYKPTDKRLLEGVSSEKEFVAGANRGEPVGYPGGVLGGSWGENPGEKPGENPGVIEHWLASPQPVVGRDIAPLRTINTRLTRLASGPSRFVLIAAGLICLLAGLWPDREDARRKPQAVPKPVAFRAVMTRREGWGLSRWARRLFATSRIRP